MVRSKLALVKPPFPFVVVAEAWPSILISLLALKLPIGGAFFPTKFHQYFSFQQNKHEVSPWHPTLAFTSSAFTQDYVFFVSGSTEFIKRVWPPIKDFGHVIVSVEYSRSERSHNKFQRAWKRGVRVLQDLGLAHTAYADRACGGATTNRFLMGFGSAFDSPPTLAADVQRSLRHYVDGGVEGRFPRVSVDSFSRISDPPRRVVTFEDSVRVEGLMPGDDPTTLVLCPSYFLRKHWVKRRLVASEVLGLFQIPGFMVPKLSHAVSSWIHDECLPFDGAVTPVICTAILRQLWGATGGGLGTTFISDSDTVAVDDDTVALEEDVQEEREELMFGQRMTEAEDCVDQFKLLESLDKDCSSHLTLPSALSTESSVSLTQVDSTDLARGGLSELEEVEEEDRALDFDSALPPPVDGIYEFEFDEGIGATMSHKSPLSDLSTVTSMSTYATLDTGHLSSARTGPPFAVGDEVLCDPTPHGVIQRALVVEANHHQYTVKMEGDGRLYDTSETGATLTPIGPYAKNQEDVFADARLDVLRHGSFGLHIDTQLESLRKIKEAKEFAKAVKADEDAEVPVYLWNERIDGFASEEDRDRALQGFRNWGLALFIKALRKDSVNYLAATYGKEWMAGSRKTAEGAYTPLGKDLLGISNMLHHTTRTNWFEYLAGSRVIHLRFPLKYRTMARDGVPVWFETEGPSTQDPQPPFPDPKVRAGVRKKLEKVINRRYMMTTSIELKSLIKYFAVPKGEDDIRIVYDATANKLNDCVWVPSFWLPTLDSLVRALDGNSWMADRDIADMFLNFQLHPSVIPFTGVDLKPMYEKGEAGPRWAFWDRNLMGFTSSPYNSIKMALVAEEVVKGNRKETGLSLDGKELNPFQWKSIRLNLPGTEGYDPGFSWVHKLRKDGKLACDIFTFVDDERVIGPTRELTWQASHRLACVQAYLGIQDAARKVRPVSQTPGAWSGAVAHIVTGLGVCVLTSEEKWNKLRGIIDKWLCLVEGGATRVSHKDLISDRGFLVYVTRTYPCMIPYLKGFHLTADSWRGGRDSEGWKLPPSADDVSITSDASLTSMDVTRAGAHGLDLALEATSGGDADADSARVFFHMRDRYAAAAKGDNNGGSSVAPPVIVPHAPASGLTSVVPRFIDDLRALSSLSRSTLPPLRVVRPNLVVQVFYGFGDAAGKGFGATVAGDYNCQRKLSPSLHQRNGLEYRVGVWTAEQEEESSNYKELCNLVETAEEEAQAGRLSKCQFFLFTDNSTAESCFFRGSSKSPKLHALIIRLRQLEMDFGLVIYLIHVSGKRMIAQGTDGVSRGFLLEGVMSGDDMLQFVDLAKTAVQRHPPLLEWIRSWADDPVLLKRRGKLKPLSPEGWFVEGHGIEEEGVIDNHGVWIPRHEDPGNLKLWTPPPAAADAALEELAKARHKRTDTFHVVAIPRLMAPTWRKLFNKVCDFTVVISPNVSFWPAEMYEPLWLGIVLPFTHHRPWCFKRAPKLVDMGIKLRGMLPDREGDAGPLLRKLLSLPRWVAPMPSSMVRGVLHLPGPPRDVSHDGDSRRGGKSVAQVGGKKQEAT